MSKAWSNEEAKKILIDWHSSGLSIAEFSRQQGICAKRLSKWRCKLIKSKTSPKPKSTPTLLPVKLTYATTSNTEAIIIKLRSGHQIKVTPHFNEQTLTRVVSLLES